VAGVTRACLAGLLAACAAAPAAPPPAEARPAQAAWTALFDGETLGAWRPTAFGGEGEVRVEDGRLVLPAGSPLTGVTWTGALPPRDYELVLTATKLSGNDFFCGLTFPVGEAHLTLVLGGWGGALCGLSCLDGMDASSNETMTFRAFDTDRPYRVRVRVEGTRVTAWVDDEVLVSVDTAGRELSLRIEVALSRPLGVATFATAAALEDLAWRPVGGGR
jgi:hypothetical protein